MILLMIFPSTLFAFQFIWNCFAFINKGKAVPSPAFDKALVKIQEIFKNIPHNRMKLSLGRGCTGDVIL